MQLEYVVMWEGPKYLVLQGPFEYGAATEDIRGATLMTRGKAHRYRNIYGGEVVKVG